MTPLAVAMPAAAGIIAWRCKNKKPITRATLAGFAASWAGDLTPTFAGKMATFAGAHAAFLAGFQDHANRPTPAAIHVVYTPLAATGALLTAINQPHKGIGAGILAYSALLITATHHGARVNGLTGAGMITFSLSDLLTAWVYLHRTPRWAPWAALATYLAAQALITAGVICETNAEGAS